MAKAVHGALLEGGAGGWRKARPTLALAKHCVAGLAWSCAVLEDEAVWTDDGTKFVEVHSILLPVIMGASAPKQEARALKLLEELLSKKAVQQKYISALLASEASLNLLVLGAHVVGVKVIEAESVTKLKASLTETLVKNVLTSKVKQEEKAVRQTAPFLRLLSHQEFKEALLPVISKALLRSPETALASVSAVLASVSLDLSVYAQDLGKAFVTSLRSKDDSVREDALAATLALSKQCSDPSAVEQLLTIIFAVLNGSEGKIGLANIKASLLLACGGLSSSAVSGAGAATLADTATKHFVKFLEAESHEGTLVLALEQLSLWASKFANCLPDSLVAWFPKGMALKTTTSAVRCAYLLLLGSALHTNTLSSALPLIPALSKVVDSAVKQSAQVAMLSEGVHAAASLVKIAGVDLATETSLASFFTIVTDMDKQLFYGEKFLSGAGSAALQSVASLVTCLLISHVDKVGAVAPPCLLRALATCLLSHHSGVRRQALREVSKVGSSLGGASTVCALLSHISEQLQTREVLMETQSRTEVISSSSSEYQHIVIIPHIIIRPLRAETKQPQA